MTWNRRQKLSFRRAVFVVQRMTFRCAVTVDYDLFCIVATQEPLRRIKMFVPTN